MISMAFLNRTALHRASVLAGTAIALTWAAPSFADETAKTSAATSPMVQPAPAEPTAPNQQAQAAAQESQNRNRERVLLEEIVVTADRKDSFGADYVQAGSFRGARVLDTPLTVSVISQELLQAQQARSILDALRNTAGVTAAQINSAVYNNLAIRGITVENRGNYRLNGSLPIVNLIDLPLENKLRVEALKGASALYYGFTTPAGIINLTTERPTAEPVNEVSLFGNSHGQIGGSADVGRRFGTWGIRVNAAANTVELGVKETKGNRKFASMALDWDPSEQFSFQFDGEYIYKTVSEPTTIQAPSGTPGQQLVLPPLLSPKLNRGAEWLQGKGYAYNLFARAQWKFAENWSLSLDGGTAYLDRDRRFSLFRNYNLATGVGQVNVELASGNRYRNNAVRGELAGGFETGPLRHQVVFGVSQNNRDTKNPALPTVNFVNNYFNPTPIGPEVQLPPSVIPNPSTIKDRGYYAFDRIDYDKWLQLLLGVRRTDYTDTSLTTRYAVKDTSYAIGLVVKPWEWASVYGTYIEGLEAGGIAPNTAINVGQSVAPRISKQYEGGVKVEVNKKLLLTAAYFDISQPLTFVDPQTRIFGDYGQSSYDGFEFSASGEITESLSIYASALFLDAIASRAANPLQNGLRIQNTPKFTGSVFVEYKLPFVEGLAVNAGVFRIGNRATNANNNSFIPGYTLFDIGARYSLDYADIPITFRVNAQNVLGKRYWEATGSSLLAQGLPSVVKFSITARF